jgi:ABC-type transport system substrate-binding protein
MGIDPLQTGEGGNLQQGTGRVAAAIHKKDIIDDVYRGAAIVAKNPLPPFVAGYNDALPESVETPGVLRMKGFYGPLRLEVMTNPRPYLPNPLRAAEMIKADLEEARRHLINADLL